MIPHVISINKILFLEYLLQVSLNINNLSENKIDTKILYSLWTQSNLILYALKDRLIIEAI